MSVSIQEKLRTLCDNAGDFRNACSISVTDDNISKQLEKALEYGEKLQCDITDIICHLEQIRARMEKKC